ncbi:MAG: protein kinase domain-containing protein, partial [Planctomycetota bacterium]
IEEPRDPEDAPLSSESSADPSSFVFEVVRRLAGRGEGYGRYTLKGEVARGGQGAILRVWDEDLRRHLAMKVTLGKVGETSGEKSGETPPVDSKTLGRFLEEAQVTGQLDHPGIVPVHELGLDDQGQVYFTMKLVKGQDLRTVFERVREGREGWTQTRALDALLRVCEAMAYAHSKGVIHRDLKPANVMVGKYGAVYVMDWGLARVMGQADRKDIRLQAAPTLTESKVRSDRRDDTDAESPLVTMDGDVVGTPSYMSPEQARGDLDAMGPASDVYSVGAILYHLLSGHMPYVPSGTRLNGHAIWGMVQLGPPAALHDVARGAPEELIAICEKAMAREIADRYPDMGAMAEDLRAYVEGRVVKAHRTGAVVELAKWVRRNRLLAASILVALLLGLGGLGATSWVQSRAKGRLADQNVLLETARGEAVANADRANEQAAAARASQARAEAAEEEGRRRLYVTDMQLAPFLWEDPRATAAQLADRLAVHDPAASPATSPANVGKHDLRGFEWFYFDHLVNGGSTVLPHDGAVLDVVLADDGRVITLDERGRTASWSAEIDLATDVPASTERPDARLGALSADGGRAAVVAGDALHLIDTRSGVETQVPGLGGPDVLDLALSDDGGLLVLLRDHAVQWIDARTGDVSFAVEKEDAHRGSSRLALSSDGRTVAVSPAGSTGEQCTIRRWDGGDQVATGSPLENHSSIKAHALSPDGSLLAVGFRLSLDVAVFDAVTGKRLARDQSVHKARVTALGFSQDGSLLATGDEQGTIGLWTSPWTLAPDRTLKGHGRAVVDLRLDRDQLVGVSEGGAARRWDLARPHDAASWLDGTDPDPVFSSDGKLIATSHDERVVLHDALTGTPVRTLATEDGLVSSLALSPDARTLAVGRKSADQARNITLWDVASGRCVAELGSIHPRWPEMTWVYRSPDALAFTPDGRHLVVGFGDRHAFFRPAGIRILRIYEVATGRTFEPPDDPGQGCVSIAFSGDGRRMVTASHDGSARIWDTGTWSVLHRLVRPGVYAMEDASISRDGRFVATAEYTNTISLWDAETGGLLETLPGHTSMVSCVAFSPDGRTLASGGVDGTVRLWSVRPATALMILSPGRFDLGGTIDAVGFSPDGRQLCASGPRGSVVWSTTSPPRDDPQRAEQGLEDLQDVALTDGDSAWDLAELAEVLLARIPDDAWTVLPPLEMASAGGAELETLEDGSILASGPSPDEDTYTVTFAWPSDGPRALRLEVLPHASLPGQGPARKDFFFSASLRMHVDGVAIPFRDAVASNAAEGLSHLATGTGGWISWPAGEFQGQRGVALFGLGAETRPGARLTLELVGDARIPGRFRLSSSADPERFDRAKRRLAATHLEGWWKPWAKLAAVHWLDGDTSAIEALEQSGPEAAAQIGELWSADGQWDRAIRLHDRALAERPTDGTVLAARAAAHAGAGRWDQAEADWLRAVEQQPRLLASALERSIATEAWSAAARLARWEAEAEPTSLFGRAPPVLALDAWERHGTLLALSGDATAYRAFCVRLLEEFEAAGIDDAGAAGTSASDTVTRACLLMPGAIDVERLPVPSGPADDYLAACTRALHSLRGGDAALAREQALEAAARTPNPPWFFLAPAITALAELELGQRDDARRRIESVVNDWQFSRRWNNPFFTGVPAVLAHRVLIAEAQARLGE